MSSRVAAIWHFQHAGAQTAPWRQVVLRSAWKTVESVGHFVRAFLEVEPIFLKRF